MSDTIERNHMIDILKGICSLFIIITHFSWSVVEREKYLFPFWIDMAVPVFMIISGYINSVSFEYCRINRLQDLYSRKKIINKFIRYTVPFMFIYLIEVIFLHMEHMISGIRLGRGWLILWIIGGYGPGGYYFPIMIQLIFLFPVIYYIVQKLEFKGLLIVGG